MPTNEAPELKETLLLAEWTDATLPIRFFGDPILTEYSVAFSDSDFGQTEMAELAAVLTSTLVTYREHTGVGRGLAANQIGSNWQMIAVLIGDDVICMVNPIISNQQGQGSYWECCLSSATMIVGEVIRPWTIDVEYRSLDGKKHVLHANEMESRLILHELDHLLGEVCIDKYTHGSVRLVRNGKDELLAYPMVRL